MKPTNIKYPLEFNKYDGLFASNYTTIDSIKTKIRILLDTDEGERPFNTQFGVALRKLIFEPMDADFEARLKSEIINKLNRYIPQISLSDDSVKISYPNNKDDNTIKLSITFSYNSEIYTVKDISMITQL